MYSREYFHLYNNKRWRMTRASQLEQFPLCAMCLQLGRTTAATIADHVHPHKGDETLFWQGELQSLCKHCHDGPKKQFEMTGRMRGCDIHGNPIMLQENNKAGPGVTLNVIM